MRHTLRFVKSLLLMRRMHIIHLRNSQRPRSITGLVHLIGSLPFLYMIRRIGSKV